MSRLVTCTDQLKQNNRKALVCYLVCGDPYARNGGQWR